MSFYKLDFPIRTRTVVTGTSPIEIVPESGKRQSFTIYNSGAVTVYINGSADVSDTNGFPILAGSSMNVTAKVHGANVGAKLYAYSATAGEVSVIEL